VTSGRGKRHGLLALCLLGIVLFGWLGIWQVERLAWKRDLIARVESRIHAEPVAAPARASWATLDLHDAEYRRVQVRGNFLHGRTTLVDALTELGEGYWVLTPLQAPDGATFLINRGFITRSERAVADAVATRAEGEVQVTGLLRRTEPRGRVLRPNDPAQDRWFSRDVAAMAEARGLQEVAPFFIDAEATVDTKVPRGGLTVVHFRNAHFVYALTWFALAGLCGAGLVLLLREPRQAASAGRGPD